MNSLFKGVFLFIFLTVNLQVWSMDPTQVLDKTIPTPNNVAGKTISYQTTKNLTTGGLKADLLSMLKTTFGVDVFVETGTYLGDTTEVAAKIFSEVHTIELSQEFYKKAVQKFAGVKNVFVYEGDSGVVLNYILPNMAKRILFYLDGHYSGGATAFGGITTPIFEELKAIGAANQGQSIILIDDVRIFQDSLYPDMIDGTASSGYPDLRPVVEAILDVNPSYQICFLGDALLAYPKDANISVSSVVRACAVHRLSISFPEFPTKALVAANDVIANATGTERSELIVLYQACADYDITLGFRSFETMWYGLLMMHDGNNKTAVKLLQQAKDNSLPGWWIDNVLTEAKKQSRAATKPRPLK